MIRPTLLFVVGLTQTAGAQTLMPAATYERAETMLAQNADPLVLRDKIRPQWIAGSDRFWYRVTTERGSEFVCGSRQAAPPAGVRSHPVGRGAGSGGRHYRRRRLTAVSDA